MDGRRFTEDELLGFCFNLFIGGLESVSTNVGWEAYHLATHPDHQAYLRANLDRVPEAVENYCAPIRRSPPHGVASSPWLSMACN